MWRTLESSKLEAIRAWTSDDLFRCDPYLVWADAVTSTGNASELNIGVLVELSDVEDYKAFFERMNPSGNGLDHLRFLPNGFEPVPVSRFITGLVNTHGLQALVDEVTARRIERFSLQNSREDIAQAMHAMWRLAENQWESRRREAKAAVAAIGAMDAPASASSATSYAPADPGASEAARDGTYLGIIDDGLPFLRVRDSLQSAGPPAHLWDQGWRQTALAGTQVKPGDPPSPDDQYWRIAWEILANVTVPFILLAFRGFLYGRRVKKLPPAQATGEPNERDEYFLSRYFAPAPRKTHGAGVLGLMAPWLAGARGRVKWPNHISGLAMVQLPTSTVLDTSGGSLAVRVIDGLRYILWQEAQDRADKAKQRPIVANVSYGVHAGPHDGTSMFERALAEMLEVHRNLHVVLPAGNAAQAGCHARRVLGPKGEQGDSAGIALEVCADNGRDTFVEFWLPRGSQVALRIRPPGSEEAFEIREGEAKIHFNPDAADADLPRTVHFGAVFSAEVAQGTNAAMALLAIGPTRRMPPSARGLNQQPRRDSLGTPGVWQLTLQNLAHTGVTVDTWVERDTAPPDVPAGSRQAYFPDSCCEEVEVDNATPENTLNGIATLKHERLHVVGAMRTDGALSEYTAAGSSDDPSFRVGPDVVAPADWSRSLPGLRTMGFLRGAIARINGTSAACAVYTRALACRLGGVQSDSCDGSDSGDPPPEITCTTNSQPQADSLLRGQDKRRLFPSGIEL